MFIRVFAAVLATASLYVARAHAETIEFPEEELATESVLPVFDKTVVVRQRTVTLANRLEVGIGGGLNLVEPLYSQTVYNFLATYHFDETNGVNLLGLFLSSGLSSAGEDLKNGIGLSNGLTFDASLAPTVQEMVFANYEMNAYYGKFSITKQTVMNLSLYGFAGLGYIGWSDSPTIGGDVGMGQQLYFTPSMGLRADLLLAMYSGPDPTHPKTTGAMQTPTSGGGSLSASDFNSTLYFRPFLTFSFIYIF
jgi:outer membrane beta-barrel protein